jgi:hypothetical protein
MAKIAGTLRSDLCPNGTVRIFFTTAGGSGNEPALEVKDLDTAEARFVRTFGLSPKLAVGLREALERNKLFCLGGGFDEKVAAMFAALLTQRRPQQESFECLHLVVSRPF